MEKGMERNISNLQDMLIKSAEFYQDKLALKDINKTPINLVTYKQLLDNVLKFGNSLRQLNIPERSHIAIISENRVQWGIAYLTCMAFNYVVVPIDNHLHSNEVINILHESESSVVIYSSHWDEVLADGSHSLKNLKFRINMDKLQKDSEVYSMPEMISQSVKFEISNLPKINSEDLAQIIFTSGSVGRAKGVMLSQKNISSNLMSMVRALHIYPSDRFLSVLPIHHTYECTCGLLCPLYSGASVHYSRSFKYLLEDFASESPTLVLGVPLLFDKVFRRIWKNINDSKMRSFVVNKMISFTNLLQKFGIADLKKRLFAEIHAKFGGAVRVLIAGGAASDPQVLKGFREFGFTMVQGYGLTETSPIIGLNRIEKSKDSAAGQPLDWCKIKIYNPDADGIGEICAKGDSVMLGYYRNDDMTNQVIRDGWFHTGDIGYLDEEGFIHICGRQKNVIIAKNGKNVFPEEIEDILNRSPYVLESMVLGENDEKEGEIIAAQIVVDAEAFIKLTEISREKIDDALIQKTIAGVVKEVNSQLTSYKQIKKFYIRESEFEKTTTQKIKRYLVVNKK